jgi:hypothetical protein
VLGGSEHPVDRGEGLEQLGLGAVGLDIGREPADAVIVADHDLKAPPAVIERAGELGHELGRLIAFPEHGEGMELAAGDVRGRVGRKRGRVDRDGKAGFLHQARRGQAHDTGAEHRDRPAVALQPKLGRELRAAPAERDPAAAVTVIVHQALVAKRLGANDEALAAVGPQSGDGSDQSARIGVDGGERRAVAVGPSPDGGAAGKEGGGACGEGPAVEEHHRSLSSFPQKRESRCF